MSEEKKLNLGCGQDYRKGYINIDKIKFPKIDKIVNLDNFPYDFEDNTFSKVLLLNILEHLEKPLQVLEEVWRISKSGAIIKIKVPFYNSSAAYGDVQHIRFFNFESFVFLTKKKNVRSGNNPQSGALRTKCFFDIINKEGIPTKIGRLIPNIKIKMKGITGLRDCFAHLCGEILSGIYFEFIVRK